MPNSNSFMAGKLRIPDSPKSADTNSSSPDIKTNRTKSEPEKPWIGQSSLRELEKRNAERMKVNTEKNLVHEVPKVHIVPSVPHVPSVTKEVDKSPIAPIRDFHRVSNSINREALEGGMFTRPSCKQVYDALYLLTRGAIQPSRTIQIGRKQLQKKAGIGSDKTLDAAVISLQAVGLLKVNLAFGSQKGNFYEVLLPEEITTESSQTNKGSTISTLGTEGTSSTNSTIGQKAPNVPLVVSTYGTKSQTVENTDTYQRGNTLSNTKAKNKTDDDSPLAFVVEKLNIAARKITGKGITKNDLKAFEDLLDLLTDETAVAAARTKSVSALVPFMTENLRRRLYSKSRSSARKEDRPNHLDVGKGSGEETSLAPQPQMLLSEDQRENTLNVLREAKEADSIFFREFKTYGEIEYTPEDFKWLMNNLEKTSTD
jgi:hypothetical protein